MCIFLLIYGLEGTLQMENLFLPMGLALEFWSCKHKGIVPMDVVLYYQNIILKHFSYLFFSVGTSIFAYHKTKTFI